MQASERKLLIGLVWLFVSACPERTDSADATALGSQPAAAAANGGIGVHTATPPARPGQSGKPPQAGAVAVTEKTDGALMLECPHGGSASVLRVEFDCASVTTYTCKDLSNVVVEFADGSRQRFEGQSGHVNTFTGTGANAGKQVVRVWVKAGPNFSGDGPGYGERVERLDQDCRPPAAGSGGHGGAAGCVVEPDGSCAPVPVAGFGGNGGVGGEPLAPE